MQWLSEGCSVGGITLKNRCILESGPFGHSGQSIVACMDAGFAAVSTETISLTDGTSPWWNIYRDGNTLYNCSKWSDLTVAQWIDTQLPYAHAHGSVVIATVGQTAVDVAHIVPLLDKTPVAGIKLCTYHAHEIVNMVRTARPLTNKPLWVKLSANWPDIFQLAQACQAAGADALVAIDSLGPIRFAQGQHRPALGSEQAIGWMSGQSIHPKALYVVDALCQQVSIPVIGVGGILDAPGAQRMRQAGASAIGLCSAILIHGLPHLKTIQQDYATLDFTPPTTKVFSGPVHLHIDQQQCTQCGDCIKRCGYMALQWQGDKVVPLPHLCRRCGLCQQHCPAITLSPCDASAVQQ